MSRSEARFSTYSGAPSLQPSLDPTLDTTSQRSNSQQYSSRFSELHSLSLPSAAEKDSSSSSQRAANYYCSTVCNQRHSTTPASAAARANMYANPQTPAAAAIAADASSNSSSWTLSSTDPRTADIRSFANTLDKMADERLDKQRYVMSGNKTEEFGKIALGAKLDRALSRRMVGQDAVYRGTGSTSPTAAAVAASPTSPTTTTPTPTMPAARQIKKSSLPSPIDEKRALEVQAA